MLLGKLENKGQISVNIGGEICQIDKTYYVLEFAAYVSAAISKHTQRRKVNSYTPLQGLIYGEEMQNNGLAELLVDVGYIKRDETVILNYEGEGTSTYPSGEKFWTQFMMEIFNDSKIASTIRFKAYDNGDVKVLDEGTYVMFENGCIKGNIIFDILQREKGFHDVLLWNAWFLCGREGATLGRKHLSLDKLSESYLQIVGEEPAKSLLGVPGSLIINRLELESFDMTMDGLLKGPDCLYVKKPTVYISRT